LSPTAQSIPSGVIYIVDDPPAARIAPGATLKVSVGVDVPAMIGTGVRR
jgi:hypothetical protein